MRDITLECPCPNCGEELNVTIPDLSPNVRSKLKPVATIPVYRFTSEDVKQFLIDRAKLYKPEAKLEVGVSYCEKKDSDPHRGYASFRIAFSNDFIETRNNHGWYEKVGENSSNIRFIQDVFDEFIQKYQYSKKDMDGILGSYKNLEKVENRFGMTEAFIDDIKEYIIPKRMPTSATESWVIFSARAESIIENMLEDPITKTVPGRIEIHDVHMINKDMVEFVVYLHSKEIKAKENPHVRRMLMGSNKSGKR